MQRVLEAKKPNVLDHHFKLPRAVARLYATPSTSSSRLPSGFKKISSLAYQHRISSDLTEVTAQYPSSDPTHFQNTRHPPNLRLRLTDLYTNNHLVVSFRYLSIDASSFFPSPFSPSTTLHKSTSHQNILASHCPSIKASIFFCHLAYLAGKMVWFLIP